MTYRVLLTLLTTLVLIGSAPALVSGYGNDAIQEPSSAHDTQAYIWQEAPDASVVPFTGYADRIYFNGQLSVAFAARHANAPDGRIDTPTLVHVDALLGYWRDCNNDGYIGNAATAQKTYLDSTSPTSVDETVCPVGSLYNPGPVAGRLQSGPPYSLVCCMIHEMIDVGPDVEVGQTGRYAAWYMQDDTSRVWADFGLPDEDWERRAGMRDSVAENPAVLFFPVGTFDSYNGHLSYADALTFGGLSSAYTDVTGDSIYDTPIGDDESPLTTVRYQGYSSGRHDNRWTGHPLVQTWHCEDPNAEPELRPSVNPDGAVVDSANNTFMGLRERVIVPNPLGGNLLDATLNLGSGCDGSLGQQTFGEDIPVPHVEDETLPSSNTKTSTDWYLQFRGPLDEPRNQVAAWGVVPRGDRTTGGTWYGHQMYVNEPATRGAQYYTFYAKVGQDALEGLNWRVAFPTNYYPDFIGPGAAALPGAREVNGQVSAPTYFYGEEACADGNGASRNWDCSAWPAGSAAWESLKHSTWGVVLGETYQLRDVDCTDTTATAPGATATAKDVANTAWNIGVSSVFDPVPEQVGEELFDAVCE